MKKMRFSEKQNDITLSNPEDGITDVIILRNEQEITEQDEQSGEDVISYEYDGNIFRTFREITENDIRSNLDYYLDYDGDEKLTDEMIDCVNRAIDEYTAQLIEEGII